jgi:hypothetical protein
LCTVGTLSGGGALDGTTAFVARSSSPSAGMNGAEPAANLSYSGEFTITGTGGTLVISDLGVLNGATGSFTEIARPVSGTGRFASPTHDFYISGTLTNGGKELTSEIFGTLCH